MLLTALPKDTVGSHDGQVQRWALSVIGCLQPPGHPAVWMLVTEALLITELSPLVRPGASGMSEGCYCKFRKIFLLEVHSRWAGDGFYYWRDLCMHNFEHCWERQCAHTKKVKYLHVLQIIGTIAPWESSLQLKNTHCSGCQGCLTPNITIQASKPPPAVIKVAQFCLP